MGYMRTQAPGSPSCHPTHSRNHPERALEPTYPPRGPPQPSSSPQPAPLQRHPNSTPTPTDPVPPRSATTPPPPSPSLSPTAKERVTKRAERPETEREPARWSRGVERNEEEITVAAVAVVAATTCSGPRTAAERCLPASTLARCARCRRPSFARRGSAPVGASAAPTRIRTSKTGARLTAAATPARRILRCLPLVLQAARLGLEGLLASFFLLL